MKKDPEIKKINTFLLHLKRYAISSAISFSSAFLLVAGMQLAELHSADYTATAILAVIYAAVRAGIKAIVEKMSGKLAQLEV